jgi:hypothetical protein
LGAAEDEEQAEDVDAFVNADADDVVGVGELSWPCIFGRIKN